MITLNLSYDSNYIKKMYDLISTYINFNYHKQFPLSHSNLNTFLNELINLQNQIDKSVSKKTKNIRYFQNFVFLIQ